MLDKKSCSDQRKNRNNILDKIAAPTREKMLDKKAFLNNYLLFDIQELIRHIHCFGYTFCHKNKKIKFC